MQRSDLDTTEVEAVMTAALAHYNQHRGIGAPCSCVSCIVISSVQRRRDAKQAEERRAALAEQDRLTDERLRRERMEQRRLPYRED